MDKLTICPKVGDIIMYREYKNDETSFEYTARVVETSQEIIEPLIQGDSRLSLKENVVTDFCQVQILCTRGFLSNEDIEDLIIGSTELVYWPSFSLFKPY